jgi:hypothetical protein
MDVDSGLLNVENRSGPLPDDEAAILLNDDALAPWTN